MHAVMADWLVLCATVEQAMRELRLQAGKPTVGGRLPWQGITPQGVDGAKWRAALVRLGQSQRALLKPLAVMEAMATELQRLYERGANCWQGLPGLQRPPTMTACAGWKWVRSTCACWSHRYRLPASCSSAVAAHAG